MVRECTSMMYEQIMLKNNKQIGSLLTIYETWLFLRIQSNMDKMEDYESNILLYNEGWSRRAVSPMINSLQDAQTNALA